MSSKAMQGPRNFTTLAFTETVRSLQTREGSRDAYARMEAAGDRFELGLRERTFIAERDGFYMASVGTNGWPYVQHRGGPRGFLRVLDETTLAFADFRGNRQYISTGNVLDNGRAALILMDYPNRRRLKVWADVNVLDATADPQMAEQVALPGYDAEIERIFRLTVRAYDWNCPQHIVRRYTPDEFGALAGGPMGDSP